MRLKQMTEEELEQLANEGYKTLTPAEIDCNNCVLGAAVYGLTGKTFSENRLPYTSLLNIEVDFMSGVIDGFDDILDNSYRNPDEYIRGVKFGRRMRSKYIEQGN